MERLRPRALRRLLDFVEGLHAQDEVDGLVQYVLRHLTQLIRCDNAVYNEANLRRSRVIWQGEPKISPLLPGARQVFERHMSEHPLISHKAGRKRRTDVGLPHAPPVPRS